MTEYRYNKFDSKPFQSSLSKHNQDLLAKQRRKRSVRSQRKAALVVVAIIAVVCVVVAAVQHDNHQWRSLKHCCMDCGKRLSLHK